MLTDLNTKYFNIAKCPLINMQIQYHLNQNIKVFIQIAMLDLKLIKKFKTTRKVKTLEKEQI